MTAAHTPRLKPVWRTPLRLHGEEADILDLGAESSRPGARGLTPQEEQARLLPMLAALQRKAPGATLSLDTYHAGTAAAALELGVGIINDISACAFDPELLDVLVQYKPGYVLMHSSGRPETMQRDPRYADVRREVRDFFERGLNRLAAAGLPRRSHCPGPGHRLRQKSGAQSGASLTSGGLALSGPSGTHGAFHEVRVRRSVGPPPQARGAATLAAAVMLWKRGVFWHRVHDVAATRQGLRVAAALEPGDGPAALRDRRLTGGQPTRKQRRV